MDHKMVLGMIFLVFVCLGCKQADRNVHRVAGEDRFLSGAEGLSDEPIPQATAIFWVDKRTRRQGEQLHVRTVKVKVHICTSGKITILSYVKQQPDAVKHYLNERLKYFRIPESMFKSETIVAGEQYVQLRYIPANIR
ncbi:MAG: DUF4891 domain-containing protein [Bacteroides sp.]|nr:DUF4891 domain-containing protein [Bacteroides sp.]